MDVALILQAVSAAAIVAGVFFGLLELRQLSSRRKRESALELVHSFQTAPFANALDLIFRMPDGLSRREVEAFVGEDRTSVQLLLNTWESLGILVHRGELEIDLVDDFFSGPIFVTHRKLGRYVEEVRRDEQRDTFAEWCMWLGDRMRDRERTVPPIPADVTHQRWRPRG